MKPLSAALWITKLVAWLVLFLVIIPGVLFYGGAWAWHEYDLRKAQREAQQIAQQDSAEKFTNIQPIDQQKPAYYCSMYGYGVPAGEIDDPKGTNHIDAPDCQATSVEQCSDMAINRWCDIHAERCPAGKDWHKLPQWEQFNKQCQAKFTQASNQ